MAVNRTASSSPAPRRQEPKAPPKAPTTARSTETKSDPTKASGSKQVQAQRIEEQKATERVQVDQRVQTENRQRALAAEDVKRDQVTSSTTVAPTSGAKKGLAPTEQTPREKAMSQTAARAAKGERAAIDELTSVIGKDQYDQGKGIDADTGRKMRQGAIDGLAGAKDHLSAGDHEKIAAQANSLDLGDKANKLLGEQARADKPGAIGALRGVANGTGIRADDAANELATVDPNKLTPGDYKTFAKADDGYGSNDRVHKAMVEGIKNDRPGAKEAAEAAANNPSTDYKDQYRAKNAAGAIAEAGGPEFAKAQQKSWSDLNARAATGDRAAIDELNGTLQKSSRDQGLPDAAGKQKREMAMKGIEGAKAHLNAGDHQKLAALTADFEVGKNATKLLGEQARADKPGAIDALRGASTNGNTAEGRAANQLATVDPSKLKAEDYKTFAKTDDGYGQNDNVHKAMVDGIKNNRPGALEAAREQIHNQANGPTDQYPRQNAANAIAEAGGSADLNKADTARLAELAKTGERGEREAAFKALGESATMKTPNMNALASMGEVQESLQGRPVGSGLYGNDKDTKMRELSKEFTNRAWQNPDTQQAVAGRMISEARSGKDATQAAEMLRDKAMTGDQDAISALAGGTSLSGEVASKSREVLNAAAANGQAKETTDALLKEANKPGSFYANDPNTRGQTFQALGESAAKLDAKDPRMDEVRKTLRAGASSTDRSSLASESNVGAAKGMDAISDRLKGEDLEALTGRLSDAGATTIKNAAPRLSAEEARPALDKLTAADGKSWLTANETKALSGFAKHMNADDVKKLGAMNRGGQQNDTLSEVLTQNKSPAAQSEAANAMLNSQRGTITGAARDKLVNHAVAKGDNALKAKVLDRLPKSPLSNENLSAVSENYTRRLSGALRDAKPGSDMNRLKELYSMQSLARTDEFKKNVNTAHVNSEIQKISGTQPLKGQLEGIRQKAIADVIGPNPAQQQQDYILSDTFQQRMKLEGPEQAGKTVKQEMGKLGLMDAKKMEDTKAKLAQKTLHENSFKIFQSQDKAQTEQSVNAGLTALAATPGISKKTAGLLNSLDAADKAKVAKHINDALHDVNASSLESAGEGVLRALNAGRRGAEGLEAEAAVDAASRSKAFKIMESLTKDGRLGSAVSAFGVAAIAAGGVPQTGKEWLSTTGSALSAMGNATDVGKLLNVGNLRNFGEGFKDFSKLSKAGQVLKVMDFAGPVADVIGVGLDVNNMMGEIERGDKVGAWTSGVSAGAGVASAAAGVAIIAGATGPLAPAVLLGGAVVGIGAWAVNSIWGESDQESFLRRGYKDRSGRALDFWID